MSPENPDDVEYFEVDVEDTVELDMEDVVEDVVPQLNITGRGVSEEVAVNVIGLL